MPDTDGDNSIGMGSKNISNKTQSKKQKPDTQ
jgi:hypothetical protein